MAAQTTQANQRMTGERLKMAPTFRSSSRRRGPGLMRRILLGATVAAVGAVGMAGAAGAVPFTELNARFHTPDTVDGPGAAVTQAGSRADVTFRFRVAGQAGGGSGDVPADRPHRMQLKLPHGLVGNPLAVPACPEWQLKAGQSGHHTQCPAETQVGIAHVLRADGVSVQGQLPLYNVEPPPGVPGQFAFNTLGVIVRLVARVDSQSYAVVMDSGTISQGVTLAGAHVEMWGVPSDPIHDYNRYRPVNGQTARPASSGAPRRAFLALPTSCDGPSLFTASLDGWKSIGLPTVRSFSEDPDGGELSVSGCEALDFRPEVAVTPTSRAADAPSGLDVDLRVPQNDHPGGLATAHVRDVRMVLPDGVSVSPASAAGLGACSSVGIGIGLDAAPDCPRSSKLGTVTVHTPVLEEPLTGDVILAAPDDNPFGSLIALYIVAEGSGVRIKLAGRVDTDPVTGRVTATFENNPQLPFSRLQVRFDGGKNASLATPTGCGRFDTQTGIESWSGKAVDLTSPMVVDQGCGPRGFDPGFVGGSVNPVAGGLSPHSIAITRPDRTAELSTLESLTLPKGLLGYVSKVDVCGDAAADAGSCGVGSRVGHVQVAAGPGGAPVWVPERGKAPTSVSLAGPYKGAPYSLSVVVPAQAGPFDLGRVVARSPLHVDRRTTQLSTNIDVSRVFDRRGNLTQTIQGGMPTIVEGIPLRLRELRVVVDREDFTVNPTSCKPASVDATLRSVDGQTKDVRSRFQVGECASLGFSPNMAMRLVGKRQTRTGTHPALRVVLTQGDGQANIGLARVVMPRSMVLDPNNSVDPELVCGYDAAQQADCPDSSVIGSARAVSPLLRRPLTGKVHLVQGIRFGPTGNRIRTTPSLLVKLRGEVAVDLYGRTTVHAGRLVTVFKEVPDARVSRFALNIKGGKKGILVVTGSRKGDISVCDNRQTANLAFTGQNGKRSRYRQTVRTPCAKTGKKAKAGKKASRST